MDVIGNNIANVNTAGYKTARVIFQDIFSQNISAGMANQGEIGGTNPMQIGLGIRLSTVDVIHSRAAFQRTDKETDMMINGDGFFIVAQQNPETGQFEQFYTRAGNFDIDNEGFLVTSGGFYVMGRTYELTTGVVDPGSPVALEGRDPIAMATYSAAAGGDPVIPANSFRIGDVIPAGTFGNVAAADPLDPRILIPPQRTTITAANIGEWNNNVARTVIPAQAATPATATAAMNPGSPGFWPPADRPAVSALEVEARPRIEAGQFEPGDIIPRNFFRIGDRIPAGLFGAGNPANDAIVTADNIADWNNGVIRPPIAAGQSWPATIRPAVNTVVARAPVFGLIASEDFVPGDERGLTRIRAATEQTILPVDPATRLPIGYPVREAGMTNEEYQAELDNWLAMLNETEDVGLPGLSVADNGDISVIVGNRKLIIGQVAMAMFANPAGLEAAGNSLYRETASSGQVVVTEAFADGAGKIEGGGLEMSNVDLANEFTDMIVTQRGFQANSRIISVTDSMLEELVNLKR